MVRAGIFIGVDQTGGLQKLNDAALGAARMHQWALAQGLADGTNAKLITDAGGVRVTPDMVYDAINAIIEGPGADQLILYFAGHGVNINRTEQWLLTEAPERTSAAVNLSGSVELARYCGIHHVVVISDACRVAPDGIQAQNVRGIDVFPNNGASDRNKPVDQFFACLLGSTAAELKDPAVAASNFSALYTTAMLDALSGGRPELFEPGEPGDDAARYLRSQPLEEYLEVEVPRRVKALRLQKKVNQNPDAIIISRDEWLARIDSPPVPTNGAPRRRPPTAAPESGTPSATAAQPRDLRGVTHDMIRSAAHGDRSALHEHLSLAKAGRAAEAKGLAAQAERMAVPFGPDHFETRCGIKVRGSRIVDAFAPRAVGMDPAGADNLLRIHGFDGPAISVLVELEGAVGALIPVFRGFLAALTVEGGSLVDVAYEPSANTERWELYKGRAAEVRALRAVAASSSQQGRFRLDHDDALAVAKRMQYAKSIDPTLAVYAAYAYYDLQALDRIRDMSGYLRRDLRTTFFDLELLSRQLRGKRTLPSDRIIPFVPLLSQGWALLRANDVKLHPALEGLERTMRDSLWSLFDAGGLRQLKQAMQTREVR